MKRFVCILLSLMLALPCMSAFATDPTPIDTIPFDEILETRDGLHHYLLLCVDQWRAQPTNLGNSDGIVLLTLDTRGNRVMLTSLIRDALVKRPDGVIGRVNYIAKNYGPEALCKVLSEHLNIRIEKYILFDFQQVANIVDYMGGVDIEVTASEASYLRRYPLSSEQTTPKMNRAGTYLFTGRAAVIYMRIRKAGGGGDLMRTQRVRTVLSLLADKCRTITYEQARALVDSIAENTTMTNMTLDEMVQAMEYAYGLRSCVIEELRIPQDDAYNSISYAGMSVKDIDWDKSREDMEEFLASGWLVIDEEFD
ncbi:MAG: LCP family protein [Clostridia bacterium]|nr:LCP family protein [Clostridia bacterium]